MTDAEGTKIGTAYVEVAPETSSFEAAMRVMAKHLTAMADELAGLRQPKVELNFSGTSDPTPEQVEVLKQELHRHLGKE